MVLNNYVIFAMGVFLGANIGFCIMGLMLLLKKADAAIDEVLTP